MGERRVLAPVNSNLALGLVASKVWGSGGQRIAGHVGPCDWNGLHRQIAHRNWGYGYSAMVAELC